jgi:hypothetical protein
MSSEPFISNDLFIFYSDLVLIERYNSFTIRKLYKQIVQILQRDQKHEKTEQNEKYRKHIVIFIATELLEYYFPFVQSIRIPFVLITTCNDDFCIPFFSFPCENKQILCNHTTILNHPHLCRWFTKNPSIVHTKLAPLPLGPKWQYTSHRFFGEDKTQTLEILHRHCSNPFDLFISDEKRELLYFHFNQSSTEKPFFKDHTNMREEVLALCETCFTLTSPVDFEDYLIELKKYKFCLSPPGRGIDTHRTWESLMVGTIPIVISTAMDSLYDDLPVLVIQDWNSITPEFLNEQYAAIRSKTYDFSQLYSSYWKKCIDATTTHILPKKG